MNESNDIYFIKKLNACDVSVLINLVVFLLVGWLGQVQASTTVPGMLLCVLVVVVVVV
jgi:hypothetical protein